MRAALSFSIFENSFEGALPESGLQTLQTMSTLLVQENCFAGTLPNRAVAGLQVLGVGHNDFEGN
eukprot:5465671-Amphidinium_carterae.1